jgi:uncharacterized integral membrane protein
MKIKLGISLLLAILAFIFISQNTETVKVDFLFWSTEMSLVLLVFIILAAGVIIGWVLNSYLRFSRNRKQVKAQDNLRTKEVETQAGSDVAKQREKESDE